MTGISNESIDTLFVEYGNVDHNEFVEYLLNPCFFNNHTTIIERLIKHKFTDESIVKFINGVNSSYSESPMMEGAYFLFPMKAMGNCLTSKRLMNKIIQTLVDIEANLDTYPLLLNMVKEYEIEHRVITFSILLKLRTMIQFDLDETYLERIFDQYSPPDMGTGIINNNAFKIIEWLSMYDLDESLFTYWLNLFVKNKHTIPFSTNEMIEFKVCLKNGYPIHAEIFSNFENKMKLLNLATTHRL